MPVLALILGAFLLIGAVVLGVLWNGRKSNESKVASASREKISRGPRTGTHN